MNKRPFKIDADIHAELKRLKLKMSIEEGKDISMAEIMRRTFKNKEIIDRLEIGARERRYSR